MTTTMMVYDGTLLDVGTVGVGGTYDDVVPVGGRLPLPLPPSNHQIHRQIGVVAVVVVVVVVFGVVLPAVVVATAAVAVLSADEPM